MNNLRLGKDGVSNGLALSSQRCAMGSEPETPVTVQETVNQTVSLIPGGSQVITTGVAAAQPILSIEPLPETAQLTFKIVDNQYQATVTNLGLASLMFDVVLGTVLGLTP